MLYVLEVTTRVQVQITPVSPTPARERFRIYSVLVNRAHFSVWAPWLVRYLRLLIQEQWKSLRIIFPTV